MSLLQVESTTSRQHAESLYSEKSKQTSSKLGKLSKRDVDSKKTSNAGPKSKKLQQVDPRDPTGRFAFEFERIDKNRDGWLSRSELHQGLLDAGWHQDEVCGLFEQIDLDNDGHITKEEFISHRSRTVVRDPSDPTGYFAFEFERIDKNKDGVLSLSELHQGLLSSGWEQVICPNITTNTPGLKPLLTNENLPCRTR